MAKAVQSAPAITLAPLALHTILEIYSIQKRAMLRGVARRSLVVGQASTWAPSRAVTSHRRIPPGHEEVPMGQKDSNLEPWTCNASLLRRKELGLMGHVELLVDGRRVSPRDLFKVGGAL